MWKIVKKSVEKIIIKKEKFTLWMKWKFKIEFASDSFGPYRYKFERIDCYFNDGLEDRGTKIFPLKNKNFDNTEIFLETDDIVIAVWERWSLMWGEKSFIDIINIKTEKKYRLFTEQVNLIYNTKEKIIINAEHEWRFKTLELHINSMRKSSEVEEELQSFFKCVYNTISKTWYLLDFIIWNEDEKDEEKKFQYWYFELKKLSIKWVPKTFNRKKFQINTVRWLTLDMWENSIK